MKKNIKISLLLTTLLLIGCGGNRGELLPSTSIAVKTASLDTKSNAIITDKDFATVTLVGEEGNKVYINDKEVGIFPASGTLDVTFEVKEVGEHSFEVYSKSIDNSSKKINIKIIKKQKSATLGTVHTQGDASSITSSQGGILFVAEQEKGVEIISVGYNDKVNSDLLATINSIDAQNVLLSKDENKLYIKDKKGTFHVMDISDLNNPIELEQVSSIEKSSQIVSEDKTTRYSINSCGLRCEDISNPNNPKKLFQLKDKTIQDVILVKNDTQILLANGKKGLVLYDVSDKNEPKELAHKDLGGNISGLSLIKKDGILFVANGEFGVVVFDLKALLKEM